MKKLLLFATFSCLFSTNAQLRLVKDLNPGFLDSFPRSLYVYNGRLFFTANVSSSSHFDIYATNGTNAGTILITEGVVGNPSLWNDSSTVFFRDFNSGTSRLYVDAQSSNSVTSIFAISGTSIYGNQVFNLQSLSGSSNSRFVDPVILNNKVIFTPFSASSSTGLGVEPYSMDLLNFNNSGVLFDVRTGLLSSDPRNFTVLGNNVFFSANDGINGRELWKTDGSPVGTSLYLDLNTTTSTANSNPDNLNVLGAQLTFAATHTTLGRELFKTNGTGSLVLIKDINISGDSNPTNVTLIGGGILYFSADNGTNGQELWSSNGNNSGTNMLKDINPSGNSNPSKFTLVGSSDIYFIANDGTNGVELWKTDGTSTGTVLVKNINPTGDGNPDYLTEYNGKLYFTADNGTNGTQLWVSDGTSTGTTMITINASATSDISDLIVFNNELYFGANAGVGKELYAYMDPALSTANFQLNESKITLYPNPSKNYFELSSEVAIEKVEVYSLMGQIVKSFETQTQYDITDLSKGVYLVKVNTTEGSLSKSLIIE